MPRKTREISGTGIYHVMMRGTNKQNVFEDSEDYLRFMTILRNMVYPVDDMGKALPQRCYFYAYCLMTNHVHLLVREAEEKLAPSIHRLTPCLSPCDRPTLPPIHPRFSAYSCAIEVRLMYVCCPFINRTTIGQQSNNNGRKSEGKAWVEWNRIGDQLEVNWRTIRERYVYN